MGQGGVRGLAGGSRLRSEEPLRWHPAPLTALLPPFPSRWLKLPPLLSSSSVALRILAGETIALVFELAQDVEVWRGAPVAGGSGRGGQQSGRELPAQAPSPCPG